jgi:hypothetical protein
MAGPQSHRAGNRGVVGRGSCARGAPSHLHRVSVTHVGFLMAHPTAQNMAVILTLTPR